MRKCLYAAVAIGGLLLLGPSPAHADDVAPAPAGSLTGLLSESEAPVPGSPDPGIPLVTGLSGILTSLPATGGAAGMPPGGTPVAADDPRLHEQPTPDATTPTRRAFSGGGRPVAGVDADYR